MIHNTLRFPEEQHNSSVEGNIERQVRISVSIPNRNTYILTRPLFQRQNTLNVPYISLFLGCILNRNR